jgi:hypothetical protein
VEPVDADFTRVLIILGVVAGLLVGLAVGWNVAMDTTRRGQETEAALDDALAALADVEAAARASVEDAAPERDELTETRDPIGEETPPPGVTAAELRAQEEPLDTAGLVAVRPPPFDVSDPADAPGLVTPDNRTRPGWFKGAEGYERAILEREKRDAPLIVYFHTDWCTWCRRLDEEFLAHDDVAGWLNRAQRVEINPEHGDAELALAREFGIRGYPGLFVLRPGSDDPRRVHPFRRGRTISTSQFLSELKDAAGES